MDVSNRIFPVVPLFVSLFPFSLPLPRFPAFSCFRSRSCFLNPCFPRKIENSPRFPLSAWLSPLGCVIIYPSQRKSLKSLLLASCASWLPWLVPVSCPAPVSCWIGSSSYWTTFYIVNQSINIITCKFTCKNRRFRQRKRPGHGLPFRSLPLDWLPSRFSFPMVRSVSFWCVPIPFASALRFFSTRPGEGETKEEAAPPFALRYYFGTIMWKPVFINGLIINKIVWIK